MDYELLARQLDALCQGGPAPLSNLANMASLLYQSLPRVNWVGFYLRKGEALILGPFQGKPACVLIPLGKGVCGTAAATHQTQLVADVHAFPGHIACDEVSASEVVIPLEQDGDLVGVLDLDSPEKGRFTQADAAGLERLCQVLLRRCDFRAGLL